jgi:WD40 repeat protein
MMRRRASLPWHGLGLLWLMMIALPTLVQAASAQDKPKIEIIADAGHSFVLSSVAFSPDGAHVLSGSNDHTIKLWDAATGMCCAHSWDILI